MNGHGYVPIKLYLPKTDSGPDLAQGHSLLIPVLNPGKTAHTISKIWICCAVPQVWSHRITGLICAAPVNTGPTTESPVGTQLWGGTGRSSMGPSSGTSPLSCLLRGKCQRPGLSGPRIVPGMLGPGMAQKVLSESPRIGRTQTLSLREKQSCRGCVHGVTYGASKERRRTEMALLPPPPPPTSHTQPHARSEPQRWRQEERPSPGRAGLWLPPSLCGSSRSESSDTHQPRGPRGHTRLYLLTAVPSQPSRRILGVYPSHPANL